MALVSQALGYKTIQQLGDARQKELSHLRVTPTSEPEPVLKPLELGPVGVP